MEETMKNSTEAEEKKPNDVVNESILYFGLRFTEDENAPETVGFCKPYHKAIEYILVRDLPKADSTLKEYDLGCQLNLEKCLITVFTTRTTDAAHVQKTKELLRLLTVALSAPVAMTTMKGVSWEIMKLGYQEDGLCTIHGVNQELFDERMKHLNDPATREIGALLLCYVQVAGDLFIALGPLSSIKSMKLLAKDCIVNGIPPASRVQYVRDRVAKKRLEEAMGSLEINHM